MISVVYWRCGVFVKLGNCSYNCEWSDLAYLWGTTEVALSLQSGRFEHLCYCHLKDHLHSLCTQEAYLIRISLHYGRGFRVAYLILSEAVVMYNFLRLYYKTHVIRGTLFACILQFETKIYSTIEDFELGNSLVLL